MDNDAEFRLFSGWIALLALPLLSGGVSQAQSGTAARSAPLLNHSIPVDADGAIERFTGAIRIPTVSEPGRPPDRAAMQKLHAYLGSSFPLVHAAMRREVVGASSLLYTWVGSDPSLPPILFLAHMDVVPVDPSSLARWTHPPFAAEIAGGFVWGRGTMDDKQAVLSILEASEALLRDGFKPRRTILFALGDDEENDGHGAEALVALLGSRGVHPIFVMDEGGRIARGTIPGVAGDVALISIAEKGIVSVQITVRSTGGHSSRPPAHTAIGILSHVVVALEGHPMPARLSGVTADMLDALAPRMSPYQRNLTVNRSSDLPPLIRSLESTATGNALIRTTTAVTLFNGGIKDNVLPSEATAVINFRILPGDSVASVLQHVNDTIGDARVEVAVYGDLAAEPSPLSPIDTPSYRALVATVRDSFPDATPVPNLLVARTDSARYYALSSNVYKFFPAIRDEADAERVHGVNERLGVADYLRAVQFMAALLRTEAAL